MFRFIVIAVALLFSSFSFSADFTWKFKSGPNTGACLTCFYPSPDAACSFQYNNAAKDIFTGYTIKNTTLNPSFPEYTCAFKTTLYSSVSSIYSRIGNNCPVGTTLNATTGLCDLPACPVGQSRNNDNICAPIVCPVINQSIESVYSPSSASCVLFPNLPPIEFCEFSKGKGTGATEVTADSNSPDGPLGITDPITFCAMKVTKAECTSKINPSPESLAKGSYTCKLSGEYTGQYLPEVTKHPDSYCPSGSCTETPPPTPEPPKPEPQRKLEDKPCVLTGSNPKTCTSSKTDNKEGTSNCGTVNGSWICAVSNPSHNGIEIGTKIESTTTADITTTTKTDTANVTSCKNIGDCKVTTTTKTTTTKTDGTGATTSVTGTCTGPSCPDKNGNPDGDGDGFGDCVGDKCGDEQEGGSASTSGDCKIPPPCDGDPFQCAILQQVALSSCLERALPNAEEKHEIEALTDAGFAANDKSQLDLDAKVNNLLSGLKTASSGNVSGGSGPCLPDYPIAFLGKTLVMEFSALCPYLLIFRFGLLFIAYLGAARIVSTQL